MKTPAKNASAARSPSPEAERKPPGQPAGARGAGNQGADRQQFSYLGPRQGARHPTTPLDAEDVLESSPERFDTTDASIELSLEVGEVTRADFRPPDTQDATLDPATRAVILTCEAELDTKPDPLRTARLHYEIAQAYESAIGWLDEAIEHYDKALAGAPDHVPTIRGARRVRIALARFDDALPLFEAEARLTAEPGRMAMLYYAQGRLLEDVVGDVSKAREVYTKALDLDPSNPSLLKALEQCDLQTGRHDDLLETYERTANAVSEDARHRAAIIVQRAQLVERHRDEPTLAAELYESALRLDPHAIGALGALERLYRHDGEWRSLATVLERASRQTDENPVRALALYQVARVQSERLGNRAESISALSKAITSSPRDRLLLQDLTRLYTEQQDHEALAEVLGVRVEIAHEKGERVALLHSLGQVYEWALENVDAAIQCYQSALGIDPTHPPVLQSLGKQLAKRWQWAELVEMLRGEAEATDSAERAAAAHARIAELLETHLHKSPTAIEHHARALTLVPGYPPSFKALTRLYDEANQHRELVELYERAIDESSDENSDDTVRLAYLIRVGRLWEDELDDPAQALHAYRRALDVDPDNMGTIHAVQRAAERAERHREVVDALELEVARIADDERKVGLLHRAGMILDHQLDDRDAAMMRFKQALAIDDASLPVLGSIADLHHRAGRWSDLLEVYERRLAVMSRPTGDDDTRSGASRPDTSRPDTSRPDTSRPDASRTGTTRLDTVLPAGADTAAGNSAANAVALLFEMAELCEKRLGRADAAIGYYRQAAERDATYLPAMQALARNLRKKGDWKGLASALELQVAGLADPKNRAVAWYQVGQVYEEHLDDRDQAIAAYEKALADSDEYRPARMALIRLYQQGGEWMKVIDAIAKDAATASESLRLVNALIQQAGIYRDELGDNDLATHCLEAVLEHDVGRIPALTALEPLYVKAGAWDKLARVYDELGAMLASPGARIAALRELARIQETKGIGELDDRLRTYEAILAIDRDDAPALAALERIGQETRDPKIMVRAYSRLSEITEHDSLAASYLTRLGQILEQVGDRRALKAYRAAVDKDPQLLTAIRGLSRVGDLLDDARAMSHSARLEAQLTRKKEMAASLFVRAGTIRLDQMNDLGAVEDFERALDVWPDDIEAAERIMAPLIDTGQLQHLVDVLSNAAGSAQSAQRKTALWLEVGRLYVQRLDNLGAGIAALKRGLKSTPGHVGTQSELADAYQRNEQWGEAVAALEQVLALTSDEVVRCQAHLELASIFDEKLKNIRRARKAVQAVLRKYPDHADALLRLADIQLRSGNEDEAVETAQRLVELARDPRKRGAALVRVARIHRARGDSVAADDALTEALSLEGPGGDAAKEFKQSIETHGSWVGYTAGLDAHIKRVSELLDATGEPPADAGGQGDLAPAYLELARAYAQGMNLPNKAIDTLKESLEVCSGDGRLMHAMATLLRDNGRADEAISQLRRVSGKEPTRPDSWQELAITFDKAGRPEDARRVLSTLTVLGVDDRKLRDLPGKHEPRPAMAAEGSFAIETMQALAVDRANATPSAKLLAAIADGIGKIYPSTLESLGLSRRDRLGPRSGHPVWDLAQRIAMIFGAEFELYEHPLREPMLTVEMPEPGAIVVAPGIRELPATQQTFLLSYAMAHLAARLHPAMTLNATQIEVLLSGAARTVSPGFGLGSPNEDEFDDARDRLRRTVARKWRRSMELAAAELANDKKQPDFTRWQWAVKQTAARAALLIADDLAASLAAVPYVFKLGDLQGTAMIHGSTRVRDLMQFWVSDRASSLRRRAGIDR